MKRFDPCLSVLLMVLLLIPMGTFAQSFKVSGTVSDKNGAVIGASVLVKGTTTGTSTDSNGRYTLTVPKSGSVLVFSFLGYVTQEFPVTSGMTTLDVTLSEDAQTLQDVVVLGFGASARKADLSTAIGVVGNMEENKNRPISSVENLLQGQVAGVTVVNQGGDPTASPSVTIRGMGSQNGENVLWVVDGVPGAPVNINDIESMVVLKDAASAAIYGAQSGAAGVILVTTKKAKAGAPSVSYEGNFGIRSAYNKPQSLDIDQERAVRTASTAAAGTMISDKWDPAVNPEVAATRTNWIDRIFRNAFYQRHQVSVSGGTDKFTSRVAFNYNADEGTLQGTFNKTASVRYTGSYQITRHISISEDAMWSNNKQRGQTTGINTDEGYTGIIWSAMSMPRSALAYNEDGSFGGTATDPNNAGIHGDVVNPLRLLLGNTISDKRQNFSTTTQLTIRDLVPGLKFNSRFTYRAGNWFYKKFSPRIPEPGKPTGDNSLQYQTYDNFFWETENALTYDNTFGKHTIGALLATTASKQRRRQFAVSAKGFDNEAEANQYLGYASKYDAPTDGYMYPDNNVALVARLSYSFDNRYFVTASWRRDYAGRLPKGNKSGDFPAVTAAWKISSEPFFKQNDILSMLKLRASWGRVGNLGAVDYAYSYPTLSRDGNGDGAQVGGLTQNKTLIYLGTAINPNLTWETSEQTDIGLDVEMFKGRLSLSADYFSKRTFNLIQSQTTDWPNYIGISPMMINQGEIRNRGFELSAMWKEQVNKNWSYYVGGNLATLKNWVYDIGTRDAKGNPGTWAHSNNFRGTLKPYQTAQDQPLYSYYLIATDGLFQSDEEAAAYTWTNPSTGKVSRIQPNAKAGDIKFVDANNDGKIDTNDRQYMNSYLPKLTYSFSAGFSWKDLSFSMMWQGAAKTKAFNATKFTYLNEAQGVFNRSVDILKAWPASNDVPRLTTNDANNNFTNASDFYLEDASYLRLKNITISYDLTRLLRKSARFASRGGSLSVFMSGENLWTITNYTGLDPEVGGIGLDAGRYPVSRVFSIGVKFTY